MSYSYDLLIDAAVTRDELSAFLTHIGELAIHEADSGPSVSPAFAELVCYLRQPSESRLTQFERNLRFAPTWCVECHLQTNPFRAAGSLDRRSNRDPHVRLVELLQQLVQQYECNLAWLHNGSYPIVLKRDRLVVIQGEPEDRDAWTCYLSHTVRTMGFPFDVGRMPAF